MNGWIRGTVMIPAGAEGGSPRGVVINPILDPLLLIERGLVVVRYRPHWGSLPKRPQNARTEARTKTAKEAAAGESVGVWLLASPNPHVIGQSYFRLIWSDGNAAKSVVEYLAGLDFVDADRIGMAGISTNGFKVYSALLSDAPLAAAVIVGACGDYHAFLHDSPVALDGAALDLDPDYERWLLAREPIRNTDRLVGTALLLVNGGRDHVISNACVEESSAILEDAYAARGAPQKFVQSWLPEGTHNDLVEHSVSEILAWWEKWLR